MKAQAQDFSKLLSIHTTNSAYEILYICKVLSIILSLILLLLNIINWLRKQEDKGVVEY